MSSGPQLTQRLSHQIKEKLKTKSHTLILGNVVGYYLDAISTLLITGLNAQVLEKQARLD